MSNAPGEEVPPPHINGAEIDTAALLEEVGGALGPLPCPLLMQANTTRGTTEWCMLMVPHAARDARVRACFDAPAAAVQDATEAESFRAVLLRELRGRVARSRMCQRSSAHYVEDFNVAPVPGEQRTTTTHVFRRVAFRSPSAFPSARTRPRGPHARCPRCQTSCRPTPTQ